MQLGVVVGVALSVIVQRDATADAPQPPQNSTMVRREGRISISRSATGGTVVATVNAKFTNSPAWGAVIGTDGPCTLRRHFPKAVGLSAGAIMLTGTVAPPITLVEERVARGVRYRLGFLRNYYAEGAPITVEASGGPDVPKFTGTVNAPIELVGYSPPTSFLRTSSYTATWTAAAGTEMLVLIAARNARNEGLDVVCRVPDTGTFTVPVSALKLIPESLDQATVTVARIAETVQILGDTRVMIDVASSVTSGPFPLSLVEPPKPPKPPETSPRLFLTLGFGYSNGSTWRLQLGQRLAHGLHLVEELNSLGSTYISADTLEDHLSFGAGVRWTPFEPRPRPSRFPLAPFIDVRAFYLTAVLGAGLRDRLTTTMTDSTEDLAWSPMASLAVGLLEIQGRDWSLGPEFRGQLARFDGKIQRDWQFMLAIHLNQW